MKIFNNPFRLYYLLAGIFSFNCAFSQSPNFKLIILHTNDMHCRVDANNLGYAAVRAVHDSLVSAGENVLLLDAGDFAQGLALGYLDKGYGMVRLMNATGYDAVTLGNHEFDYGAARVLELKDSSDFLFLSNARLAGTHVSMGDGFFHIFTFGSVKVGVIGVSTPETLTKSKPSNTIGYTFDQGTGELAGYLQNQIDEVKAAGAEYVIVLGHLGVDSESAPWRSTDIIPATAGIDVFIDGHSHTTMDTVVQDRLNENVHLVQTGYYSKSIGKIVIEDSLITGELISSVPNTINTGDTDAQGKPVMTANLEIYNLIKSLKVELAPLLNKVVAYTETFLNGEKKSPDTLLFRNGVRTGETNLGDFTADALRYISDAQVAVINGGSIRTSLTIGNITAGNLNEVFPFGNDVIKLKMPGSKLQEALEYGTRLAPEVSAGFPQVSGLNFEVHIDAQMPDRVQNIMVNGVPLNPDSTYTLATNDFLAAGGDGYIMFAGSPVSEVANYSSLDAALITFITDTTHSWGLHGIVSANGIYSNPDGEGRIIFVSTSSINENNTNLDQISIYPNPAINTITISSQGSMIKRVTIYDLSGQLIRTCIPDNNSVTENIADLTKGIYLINTMTGKGVSVNKIIKL
jgi:2',3'-cyclic-nucleotide 2'-phosphodiesterase (5'-nucleotidase family)